MDNDVGVVSLAMRANPGPQEHAWITQFNYLIMSGPTLG
jgi:uncharacterized oxidoreductase